jgi:hypothetical protein
MATSDQPPEGGDTERCKRCDGTGEVLFIGEAWTGPHRSKMGPCPDCDGTGTKPAPRGAEQERGCTCTPKPDGQAPDMPAPDCPEHGAEGDEWERERCQSCGRPYERVWAATNALWNAVVGGSAGLRCPECFDREARAAGFSPYWAVADGHFLIPENRRAEGDEEPCQPPGAEDTITVWFCAQEPLHAAYVSAASDEEFDYKDCSCGANLVKAPFVPASTLTEARRERDGLIDPGDKLQSAASRLAEWVRGQDAPYEVAMAAIEARSAVEQWTGARSLLAEGSSRDG